MPQKAQRLSPLKAIRKFCLYCVGESATEVKLCRTTECPLHTFRFGTNPARKKQVETEEKPAWAKEVHH